VKGSFFLTGNFLRNPEFQSVVQQMRAEGHAIGPHSDRHLLYNSWENRDSLLVSEKEFRKDLKANMKELREAGTGKRKVKFFLAPFEWYNREIAEWSRETGLTLINFTPGTGTNADYTTPGMGGYKSSDVLWDHLSRFEERNRLGLKGAIILVHLGTHPDRQDKFYNRLGDLIDELRRRGYDFGRF
jgi:peptidoglycan/xylan/chitin deacetylase (PgdA/CDA1 family)